MWFVALYTQCLTGSVKHAQDVEQLSQLRGAVSGSDSVNGFTMSLRVCADMGSSVDPRKQC